MGGLRARALPCLACCVVLCCDQGVLRMLVCVVLCGAVCCCVLCYVLCAAGCGPVAALCCAGAPLVAASRKWRVECRTCSMSAAVVVSGDGQGARYASSTHWMFTETCTEQGCMASACSWWVKQEGMCAPAARCCMLWLSCLCRHQSSDRHVAPYTTTPAHRQQQSLGH